MGRRGFIPMFEISPDLDRALRDLHRRGKSCIDIARLLDVDVTTVRRHLKRSGLFSDRRHNPDVPSVGRTDHFDPAPPVRALLMEFIVPSDVVFEPTPEIQEHFRAELKREIEHAALEIESNLVPKYRGYVAEWGF